jgi:hypothetical protein
MCLLVDRLIEATWWNGGGQRAAAARLWKHVEVWLRYATSGCTETLGYDWPA